ncbi:recombination mediator RecR [bacterium]|nr:recombination mediator RecR [bacterium]
MNLPISLIQLIAELSKLPGIGKKTAKRLAFSLLMRPAEDAYALAASITRARESLRNCVRCFGFTDTEICDICADPRRNHDIICVVEDPRNIFTIENSNIFNGIYHVLQGAISPLQGITPEKLRIAELEERIRLREIKELVISTNPTLEGEATAHFLMDIFKDRVPVITRIARGMPAGGDLEFADSNTLARAFEGRMPFGSGSNN